MTSEILTINAPPSDDNKSSSLDQASVENDVETKLYKRRWLVLLAITCLSVNQGFYGWYIPIADILRKLLDINESQYNVLTQINCIASVVSIVPCSMLVSRWGLRKSTYALLVSVIINNLPKALCLSSEWPSSWPNELKYPIIMVSEVFLGIANSISYCIQPKMAREWFANSENTLSQIAIYAGLTLGCTTVLFVPYYVKSVDEIHKLSPVFVVASLLLTLLVAVSITRSTPKIAPSRESIIAKTATHLPTSKTLFVVVTNPHFMVLFVIIALDTAIFSVEQLILEPILATRNYDNQFVGNIYAIINMTQMVFILPISRYTDKSDHHLVASRYYAILFALSLASLNVSLDMADMHWLIIVNSVIVSLAISLVISAVTKIMYISAVGLIPEHVVGAMFLMQQSFFTVVMDFIVEPLRVAAHSSDYRLPLAVFCVIISLVNVAYAFGFKQPDPVELRAKVSSR